MVQLTKEQINDIIYLTNKTMLNEDDLQILKKIVNLLYKNNNLCITCKISIRNYWLDLQRYREEHLND